MFCSASHAQKVNKVSMNEVPKNMNFLESDLRDLTDDDDFRLIS